MAYCDNCGRANASIYTNSGGALCSECHSVNRLYLIAELSIDLKDRSPDEIIGKLEIAPPSSVNQVSPIAYYVFRDGELSEVATDVSLESISWLWNMTDEERIGWAMKLGVFQDAEIAKAVFKQYGDDFENRVMALSSSGQVVYGLMENGNLVLGWKE